MQKKADGNYQTASFHREFTSICLAFQDLSGCGSFPVANTGGALRGETAFAQQWFRDTKNRSHTAKDIRFDLK